VEIKWKYWKKNHGDGDFHEIQAQMKDDFDAQFLESCKRYGGC